MGGAMGDVSLITLRRQARQPVGKDRLVVLAALDRCARGRLAAQGDIVVFRRPWLTGTECDHRTRCWENDHAVLFCLTSYAAVPVWLSDQLKLA